MGLKAPLTNNFYNLQQVLQYPLTAEIFPKISRQKFHEISRNFVSQNFRGHPYLFACKQMLLALFFRISLPNRDALGSNDVPATVGILQAHTRRTGCCHTAPAHRISSWRRILGRNWYKFSSLLFTLTASSVGDPWHFGADPYPRIRTSDYWIPIRLRIRI